MPKKERLDNKVVPRKIGRKISIVFVLLLTVVAMGWGLIASRKTPNSQFSSTSPNTNNPLTPIASSAKKVRQPKTLRELLQIPLDQLANMDIAVMNLLCAEGLNGSEGLEISRCLERLAALSKHIEKETARNYHRFQENPKEYNNSIGYYRMGILGTVLAEDFGIHYNPKLDRTSPDGQRLPLEISHANSKDIFIHGLLGETHFGTCASMPVLYVALARRLGYPINLAAIKYHLYVRYEEENGKHLNVEATEDRGFTTPTDEDYKGGPFPSMEEQIKELGWLRPMSPSEMLGAFLFARAGCLRSMKQYGEEAEIIATAARYLPDTPTSKRAIQASLRRAIDSRNEMQLTGQSKREITTKE